MWRAWADPKEIVQWWGPFGFKTDADEREFKAGGAWKHTMIGPDGVRYPNSARYEEIVEHDRIVLTNGGGREGGDSGVHFRAVITFVAKGDKTELTMRSVFDTPAERDRVAREYGAVEGGKQTLSRLAAHVEGDFVISRLVDAPREKVWECWTEPAPRGLVRAEGVRDNQRETRLPARRRSTTTASAATASTCGASGCSRRSMRPPQLSFISAFSDEDGGLGGTRWRRTGRRR